MLQPKTNSSAATPFQPECPHCEVHLRLLQKIWKMSAKGYVSVFECPSCHKLIWDD